MLHYILRSKKRVIALRRKLAGSRGEIAGVVRPRVLSAVHMLRFGSHLASLVQLFLGEF